MRLKTLREIEIKVAYMKLHQAPFDKIKNKTKKIEMRLNDEKRQKLRIGEYILFTNSITNESIKCKIKNITKYPSFKELYENYDLVSLGYDEGETGTYHDMETYYSLSDIEKYGVLAIEIEALG